MTKEEVVTNKRIINNSRNYLLLSFGIILFIVHYICNSIAAIIGCLEPNIVLYEPSYLTDFVNNFLYPWIVLSYQPYGTISFILGIIAILTEVAAIVIIFFKIPKNFFPIERSYLYPLVRYTFLANFMLKHILLYLTSYVIIKDSNKYPNNIFWSFHSGNGLPIFFSYFFFFFLVQVSLIFILVYFTFRQLKPAKLNFSQNIFSILFPIVSLLVSFKLKQNNFSYSDILFEILFKTLNVAPPLDLNPNYLSTLDFYLVTNIILAIAFIIYFITIQFLIKRKS